MLTTGKKLQGITWGKDAAELEKAMGALFIKGSPIPVSIPPGVIGHFPMDFIRRLPQLEVEIGAGIPQILVAGVHP